MNALDSLRLHTAKEREAKRLRDRLAAERAVLVKAAFAEGHTGPAVAKAAGCSKERAYQIRDGNQGRKHRAAVLGPGGGGASSTGWVTPGPSAGGGGGGGASMRLAGQTTINDGKPPESAR
jgi:hypothetical protein